MLEVARSGFHDGLGRTTSAREGYDTTLATVDALLHRSEQGSQYTSQQLQRLVAENGITCAMSRADNVWDRAIRAPLIRVPMARLAMESFFSTLKTEQTARKVYRTRGEAFAMPA